VQIELHQLELRYSALRATDPARRRKLLSALCETGQQVPVVVVTAATTGHYVLIDGYLRVDVLHSLGHDMVEATVWPMGQTEALIARFHLEGRARSTLEEAWLLEHLAKDEGLSLEEMGRRLCRTKSWVSRRLGIRKVLATEVQAKVAAGQIPPQAAMKYLLPLARANCEHARKLVAGLGAQRISVRQMGRFYTAYRAADAVGRARLCDSPLLFLQMDAQAERGAEAQTTGRGSSGLGPWRHRGAVRSRPSSRLRRDLHRGDLCGARSDQGGDGSGARGTFNARAGARAEAGA